MVTYNRIEMTRQCVASLFDTADKDLYSLIIVDNGSTDGTVEYLQSLSHPNLEDIIFLPENTGTASALNQVWKIGEQRGQHVGKIDNDVVFLSTPWLNQMTYVLDTVVDVGLVGLKRKDLEEKPNHTDAFYRTNLYVMPNNKVIELSHHVMGTCWLVANHALKKLGGLRQLSVYGFDDAIYCSRMAIAGYYVAFIPDLVIDHIDPGDPMYPEYTQWKQQHAGEVLASGAYDEIMRAYKTGLRDVLEPFE